MLFRPPAPGSERASNVVLWSVFAVTALAVGAYFLPVPQRRLDADAALAMAGLLGRTAVYVLGGLALEGLLMRAGDRSRLLTRRKRTALHAGWVSVMLLCVALAVDLLVFAFAGYHLTTAARILFSDGPDGVGQVVEATGLSPSLLAGSAAALAAALGVATFLSRVIRRLSCRVDIVVPRRVAIRGLFVALGVLALLEAVSHRVRNPFLWERELRSVPLAFSFVRPDAELASFRVAAKRPPSARERVAGLQVPPLARKPDIVLVVIESLRKDVVTPEIMPRLSAFGREGWTFEHPVTAGNVTHTAWYGLFHGEVPAFFDAVKRSPEEHGSVPLEILRRLGYRVELFATPDTAYQDLESIVFGPGGRLLDRKFHPAAKLPAERDRAVVEELARTLAVRPAGGGVYLVALDSTHFDYGWGADFDPPFTPWAARPSIARQYELDAHARAQLVNRYRNSAAWVDQLLGRVFDALAATGRLDRACVIVTGDHGEAFWEHGTGTHGTDLGSEQLEIAFAMRLPGRAPQHFPAVLSTVDVMPTLLRELGVKELGSLRGVPVQDRLRTGPTGALDPGVLAPRAALSFRGWNERTYRFALTTDEQRMLFELDRPDPLRARRLALKDVTDLRDVSLLDGEGGDPTGAYQRVIRELPAVMDELPFLEP